jgi:hypothetical protein
MTRVYYWQGASGESELLSEHGEVIDKILNQIYAPADLEKLHGNNRQIIYSFRVNIRDRLLFTTRVIDDKSYLHVLEYIENHDYQKSRFLKHHQVLKHCNAKLDQEVNQLQFELMSDNEHLPVFEKSETTAHVEKIGLDYFNQQFIELKHNQQQALRQPLPLILTGVGGSGKTYTALAVLRQFIGACDINQPGRILYVTNEPNLVNKIKMDWVAFCGEIPESIQVEHLTYLELLKQCIHMESNIADHYADWAKNQKSYSTEINATTQYEEFRICSVYTQEQYMQLGVHQSRLNPEHRPALYQQYENFQDYLISQKLIDPVFSAFTAEPKYQLIVVDEAQLFSLRQLKNIHQLAINSAILYCMDPLQNLVDTTAIRQLYQQLHWSQERGLGIHTISLDKTYRCSELVVRAVNAILTAKHEFMGTVDKTEAHNLVVDNSHTDAGYVALTSEKQLNQYQAILDRHISPDFAVITYPALIEKACERFQTPLVFTLNQIQGLDYHTIVIYQLFSGEISINNCKKIHLSLLESKNKKISQKDKRVNQELAPWFNTLYTAYTRAKHTLLIVEETTRHDALLNRIKQAITTDATIIKPELSGDWHAEIRRQQNLGHAEIVEQIKKQPIIPAKFSLQAGKPKQKNQKSITSEVLVSEARLFFENFDKTKNVEELVQHENFLDIVFENKFSVDDTAPKSLFQHIIENNDFTHRFCVVLQLKAKITSAFVKKAIEYPNIPFRMSKILIVHIFIHYLSLLEDESVAIWLDRTFEKFKKDDQENIQHEIANRWVEENQLWVMFLSPEVKLQKSFFFPAVFSKILATRIDETNNTPLYLLTTLEKGREFLSYLVDQKEDVLRNIPNEVWTRFLVNPDGINLHVTPLIKLIFTLEGVKIFNKFLRSKSLGPIFMQIYIELCKINSNRRCSLLWFIIAQKGTEVLKTMIEDHGDKIQYFPIEAWSFLTPEDLEEHSRRSAIFELTATDNGLLVLEMLIKQHYDIIEKISPETWGLRTGSKGSKPSALYNLVNSEKGLQILGMLIEGNNNIIDLPLEAWTCSVIHSALKVTSNNSKNRSFFEKEQTLIPIKNSALDCLKEKIEKFPDKKTILDKLKEIYGNDFGNQSEVLNNNLSFQTP